MRRATPGFDPGLLVRLKNQFCGTYARLGDGKNLERVSREIIALLAREHGDDSPTLFPYQMYLEEAFYLQGRYPQVITQADANYAHFNRVLGDQNQLTLATLATRAAAEGQMQRYADAERDDLLLYAAEQRNPSGKRMEEGSLIDAATDECHRGDFADGILHAREVARETASGVSAQPAFYNGSLFTTAECILGEQEAHPSADKAAQLDQAKALLNQVDVKQMSETNDDSGYVGALDVARARLALLRGDREAALRTAAAAKLLFAGPGTDPFEKNELQRVTSQLHAESR